MKNRLYFTEKYLENRPAFFSLIRPIEANLMYENRKLLTGKVLDFGCGDGFFANLVFGDKKIDVGLDVEQSRIDQAHDKKVYKKLKKYNGSKIPYSANYFGSVFSNSVLEHVPDLKGNLKEIYKVVRPGGYFLTTVMTKNWDKYLLGSKIFGKRYGDWLRKDQEHENLLTPQEWVEQFEKAGFSVEKKVGYLNKKISNWLEIWHYLSIPSVFSQSLFGKWVLWKDWYLLFNLHKVFEGMNKKSFVEADSASSIFFILRKKK